jgi:hypothetical protein
MKELVLVIIDQTNFDPGGGRAIANFGISAGVVDAVSSFDLIETLILLILMIYFTQ